MSLGVLLGLQSPESESWDGELFLLARSRWASWQRSHPVLQVCDDLEDLRGWAESRDVDEYNPVLLALAEQGAVDGGDDPAATAALLWLLLGGAVRVAEKLLPLSDQIDELVAAQMWICARTIHWRKGVYVASSVLMNTRREVLTDLGVSVSRGESERGQVKVFAPQWVFDLIDLAQTQVDTTAADRLHDIFEEAAGTGLVSPEDCQMLLDLARRAQTTHAGRGLGGLLEHAAATSVAADWGVSRATVSRRAGRALTVLQGSYGTQVRSA